MAGRHLGSSPRHPRKARLGRARRCGAGLGMAWQGIEGWADGRIRGSTPRTPTRGRAQQGLAWHGAAEHSSARLGRGYWRANGFSAVRFCGAHAGRGWAGRCSAGLGRGKRLGDWQSSGFETPTPTQGAARQCWAWRGVARQGISGGWPFRRFLRFNSGAPTTAIAVARGNARQGEARHGGA